VDVNWLLLAPELALGMAATLIILGDAFAPRGLPRAAIQAIAVVGVVISGALAVGLLGRNTQTLNGTLVIDDYALSFKLLFLVAALLVVLSSSSLLASAAAYRAEFVGLLLLATVALMVMASANDLITAYIALEMSSLSIAFLSAWYKRDLRSTEAGLKYFLLSAMSSAVLLYGMALLYGLTGQTRLDAIARELTTTASPALFLSLALLLAGFGFKISAVPFQLWTPDVYEGAPTPVTAFISVASKAAGFALAVRVFMTALPASQTDWIPLITALAVATMTVGNIVALVQTNIKRMLAYSSIAQAGYVLVGVAAASERGLSAMLFYLAAYTVTNLAAFGAVIAITRTIGSERIADFRGLRERSPGLSFAMAVSLLSLAGLPPFVGFFAKLYVFWAAAEAGLIPLVLVGVINSAISLFYYAQVIHDMYMLSPIALVPPANVLHAPRGRDLALGTAVTLAVVGVIALGIFSGFILSAQDVAARTLTR
jgi:NADH-quinone oxidoreductase subunit N